MRFFGRRVYAGFIFVLQSAMRHGLTPDRVHQLREFIGADRRTLQRWRQFWLEQFPDTPFWKDARARFSPALDESFLPWSLCKRKGARRRDRLLQLMRFLAPITTSSFVFSGVN